jgi:hypothetical protein
MFHWPFGARGLAGPNGPYGFVQKEKTTGSYKTVMPRNGDHVHFVMTEGMINLHNARQAKGIWSHEPRAYMTIAGDAYRMLIFDLVFAQAEDDDASNGPGSNGPRRYFAFHEIDALDVWTRHREAIDADDALVLAKMGQGPGSLRANLADALAKRHDAVMLYGNIEQTKGRTYAFLSFFAEFADAADPVPHDTLEPIERIARAALVAKADRDAAMAKLMTGPTESWNSWLFGIVMQAACDVTAFIYVYGSQVLLDNIVLFLTRVLASEFGKFLSSIIGDNATWCAALLLVEISLAVVSLVAAAGGVVGLSVALALAGATAMVEGMSSRCSFGIMRLLRPIIEQFSLLFMDAAGSKGGLSAVVHAAVDRISGMLTADGLLRMTGGALFVAVDAAITPLIAGHSFRCFARMFVHMAVGYTIGSFDPNSRYIENLIPVSMRLPIRLKRPAQGLPTHPNPNTDSVLPKPQNNSLKPDLPRDLNPDRSSSAPRPEKPPAFVQDPKGPEKMPHGPLMKPEMPKKQPQWYQRIWQY